MSESNIPRIEPAFSEARLCKNKVLITSYLMECELRKQIVAAMQTAEAWQEFYDLVAPNCIKGVQKLISKQSYSLPIDRKEELLNGALVGIKTHQLKVATQNKEQFGAIYAFAQLVIVTELYKGIIIVPTKKYKRINRRNGS